MSTHASVLVSQPFVSLLISKLLHGPIQVGGQQPPLGDPAPLDRLINGQGPFVVSAGRGHVAKVGQHEAEVAVPDTCRESFVPKDATSDVGPGDAMVATAGPRAISA
jgi:hypothetical protein